MVVVTIVVVGDGSDGSGDGVVTVWDVMIVVMKW